MNRYLNLILMAAGKSERYGSNKLMSDVDGKPMYRHIFDLLARYSREHGEECRVTCVSQYSEILEAAKAAGFAAVRNPRPEDGLSLTIRLGLTAGAEHDPEEPQSIDEFDRHPEEGAVFFTADQPYVQYKSLEKFLFLAHTAAAGIVSAVHGGVPGNPVSFDRTYYPELMELKGDTGGRSVMKNHPDDVEWFEMPKKELKDIDWPEDLESKG